MLEFIIGVCVICLLFFVGYKISGAVFKILIWLCILLPISLVIWGLAIMCCCTLILIPIGMKLFKVGVAVLIT